MKNESIVTEHDIIQERVDQGLNYEQTPSSLPTKSPPSIEPNSPISHTFTKPPKTDYGSGMPTGIYDPNRPDGPDYSTSSVVNPSSYNPPQNNEIDLNQESHENS